MMPLLNGHNYPPSPLSLLLRPGPALRLLGWLERAPHLPGRPLLVFGGVPTFFYLIHLALVRAVALVAALVRFGPAILDAKELPPGYGYNLPVAYGRWARVVLARYPACRWFAGLKRRKCAAWLRYL